MRFASIFVFVCRFLQVSSDYYKDVIQFSEATQIDAFICLCFLWISEKELWNSFQVSTLGSYDSFLIILTQLEHLLQMNRLDVHYICLMQRNITDCNLHRVLFFAYHHVMHFSWYCALISKHRHFLPSLLITPSNCVRSTPCAPKKLIVPTFTV